ncbi:hypothetical protein [Agromyces flavus]|uniref:hypothetical protein n=1 Tax=Agromyces flavus TaxID=589382 RepID=UPI003606F144
MARPLLTLAALATAAVAGLEVRAARAHTRDAGGAFDAVELHSTDGRRLLIRAPRTQTAESEQSADLVALRALTLGIRSRLPFAVPEFLGQAPIGPTRAVVTEFIPGAVRSADELTANPRWPPTSAARSPPSTPCPRASSAMPVCRDAPPPRCASPRWQ